jgi:hypothetical protein
MGLLADQHQRWLRAWASFSMACSVASHAPKPSSSRSATSGELPRVQAGQRTVRLGDRGVWCGAQAGRIVVAEHHVWRDADCRR